MTLRAFLIEETDDRASLRFEVRDTGIGIPRNKLPILFLPFTQADGSTTRRFGGTGLGLAISKQLAQMMGESLSDENSRYPLVFRELKILKGSLPSINPPTSTASSHEDEEKHDTIQDNVEGSVVSGEKV